MPRMPKWVKELEVSERWKWEGNAETLNGNLESECYDFLEYPPKVCTDRNHKPKTQGDLRYRVTFFGLNEADVYALIESLQGFNVEK